MGKGIRAGVASLVAVLITLGLAPQAKADSVRYRDEIFADIKTTTDLVYGAAVDYTGETKVLRLDVHEPAGDKAKNRAAVVWVYGGYFQTGSKDDPWYKPAWEHFVRAGYVTIAINYRTNPNLPHGAGPAVTEGRLDEYVAAMFDAQHDAQAAVRWVRANATKYRINPERIAIAGHSAGGIVANMVAFNDHDPGDSGNPGYSSRVAAAVAAAGGSLEAKTVRIDPGEPPLLVSHGVVDDVVPFPAAVPSCAMTVALGNICDMVLDPDQDHGVFGYDQWRDFLYRRMIQKPGLSVPTNVTVVGTESLAG